jgi:hypothetical protein
MSINIKRLNMNQENVQFVIENMKRNKIVDLTNIIHSLLVIEVLELRYIFLNNKYKKQIKKRSNNNILKLNQLNI